MTAPEVTVADRAAFASVAREIAREAGLILMDRFQRLERGEVRTKDAAARNLISEADLASERFLVDRLRAAFPDTSIEAEEEARDPADERLRWFLDPLDGTNNFVHGLPMFCVSLGLYRGLEPQVGVVHVPRLDETFSAVLGEGAKLNGRSLRVSDPTELRHAILATGFPYRRGELEHDNLENFGRFYYDVRGLRRMGSAAIDLAYTAAGRLDGFWELHLAPHDVAAGALLVREAGGIVTDADGGEDWLRGGHVVAAGPGLHEAIRERIRH